VKRRVIGKITLVSVLATALTQAAPLIALAEDSSGSSTGGINLLLPNMVEFIPMIIAFFIMWFVFAKYVYPIIMGMIDKRANTIKENLEAAEQSKVEAARLLDERQAQLDQAKADAAKIIDDAKKAAEATRAQIEAEAREEASNIIAKANANVEAQKKAAVAELQHSVADISVSVAGKLIGEDLSDDEHRRIIERYVEEAGSLNAS